MKDTLNNELIKVITEKLLDDISVAGYLMEILSIGKEAVYRRLRGDVPFSFYEVVLIARALSVSLDEIAGNTISHGAMFTMSLQGNRTPWDYFYSIFHRYRDLYVYLKGDPSAKISVATNLIPFIFHCNYKKLTKFRLCRWLYQKQELRGITSMKDFEVPERIYTILNEISELIPQIAETHSIWDNNVFSFLVSEIKYFSELGFVSDEDKAGIKDELLSLLDEAEKRTYTGAFDNGNKIYTYISNINFDASYGFMEKSDFKIALLHVYSIDHIDSQHADVCAEQKNWIESLKRYSTLITHCGEAQRTIFFRRQREMIDQEL